MKQRIITFLFTLCLSLQCFAQKQELIGEIPKSYYTYETLLLKVLKEEWEDNPYPAVIPSQIEQETCISLTHSKCWTPYAELKTSREYGFGFGQITITKRFNTFEEVKTLNKKLADWQFEDRYNPQKQIISLIAMMKRNYNSFKDVSNAHDRMAFSLASYNGGLGGINSDRRICRNTKNCDYTKWWGNVELYSTKAKTNIKGYGKSFFEINREYPRNIMFRRIKKYELRFESLKQENL